jgi:hypothetical protein
MPGFFVAVYYEHGDSVIDTSKKLHTVSSFGESHRRVNPAVAFNLYLSLNHSSVYYSDIQDINGASYYRLRKMKKGAKFRSLLHFSLKPKEGQSGY